MKLGFLRSAISANVALLVAILVDRVLHANFGPASLGDWASYATYVVGVVGIFFDKAWGRAAYGIFLVIAIAQEGESDATQLQSYLYDLYDLSCGVLIALAVFTGADRAPGVRPKGDRLHRIANLRIEIRSLQRTMRVCLGVNLAILIALIAGSFIRSDGTLVMPKTAIDILIRTWPLAYLAGLLGLWFDKGWGRAAFGFFLMFVWVIGETGYSARLTNVLLDLFFQSSGVILVFMAKPSHLVDADRPAIGDVFS